MLGGLRRRAVAGHVPHVDRVVGAERVREGPPDGRRERRPVAQHHGRPGARPLPRDVATAPGEALRGTRATHPSAPAMRVMPTVSSTHPPTWLSPPSVFERRRSSIWREWLRQSGPDRPGGLRGGRASEWTARSRCCGIPRRDTATAPCARATPGLSDIVFIKRVVAGPGDTIAFRDGLVVRNGRPVSEPYARRCTDDICEMPEAITVPEGRLVPRRRLPRRVRRQPLLGAGPDQGDHGHRQVPLLAAEQRGTALSKTCARAGGAR